MMAIHQRRHHPRKARHVDKDELNMNLEAVVGKIYFKKEELNTERGNNLILEEKDTADNMGPSYLLGASEPLLLPLNEVQRGSQIDRNTERAAPFDWRSCQGEPKVLSQACAAFHKAALLS
ncbi:hypothetical protein Q8A73_021184 [Channa argus]|nr:hypothetical protein Q8A73_021184 [Channa argus]